MRREEIIEAVKARMREVTPHVFEWQTSPLCLEELPAIILRDAEASAEYQVPQVAIHTLNLGLDLLVAAGEQTIGQLRKMMNEVVEIFKSDDQRFPPMEADRFYKSSSIRTDQQDKLVAGALMEFEIKYLTKADQL
jgi:hypothetical protein